MKNQNKTIKQEFKDMGSIYLLEAIKVGKMIDDGFKSIFVKEDSQGQDNKKPKANSNKLT